MRNVSVLGITDYFFIDGYRKIRDLRAGGDLQLLQHTDHPRRILGRVKCKKEIGRAHV